MNSKQRRASRRYWKYVIELPYEDRWDIDNERRMWCNKNIGEFQVKWANARYGGEVWYFCHAKDAAFFALKWS